MSSVAEITEKLQSRFNPGAAAGLNLVFQFNVSDSENYYIEVRDGACQLVQGDAEDPSVTLILDKATLKGIVNGEIQGMQAFMSGRLRAEGNLMLAMKLGELFPS